MRGRFNIQPLKVNKVFGFHKFLGYAWFTSCMWIFGTVLYFLKRACLLAKWYRVGLWNKINKFQFCRNLLDFFSSKHVQIILREAKDEFMALVYIHSSSFVDCFKTLKPLISSTNVTKDEGKKTFFERKFFVSGFFSNVTNLSFIF